LRDAQIAGRIWVLMRGLQNPQALRSRLMPLFIKLSVFAAIVPLSVALFLWMMVATHAWMQLPATRGLLIGSIPMLLLGLLVVLFVPDIIFKGYCWLNSLWSRKHPDETQTGSSTTV